MALNPLYQLSACLNHTPVSDLIDVADNKTRTKFADYCVSNAKDDEDLTDVRVRAEHAFDWWNNS
jgi:hypothetical protein